MKVWEFLTETQLCILAESLETDGENAVDELNRRAGV